MADEDFVTRYVIFVNFLNFKIPVYQFINVKAFPSLATVKNSQSVQAAKAVRTFEPKAQSRGINFALNYIPKK